MAKERKFAWAADGTAGPEVGKCEKVRIELRIFFREFLGRGRSTNFGCYKAREERSSPQRMPKLPSKALESHGSSLEAKDSLDSNWTR